MFVLQQKRRKFFTSFFYTSEILIKDEKLVLRNFQIDNGKTLLFELFREHLTNMGQGTFFGSRTSSKFFLKTRKDFFRNFFFLWLKGNPTKEKRGACESLRQKKKLGNFCASWFQKNKKFLKKTDCLAVKCCFAQQSF